MRIIICPDSFKESLLAHKVCIAIEKGIKKVCPDSHIISIPIADGGRGTVECLINGGDGKFRFSESVSVKNPSGDYIKARYAISKDDKTAIIEMASASGLMLVPQNLRNPFYTSTFGTGELIKHALDNNCRRIIIGLGDSATIDGGAGMAQALGVEFVDKKGKIIKDCMNNEKIGGVAKILFKNIHPAVKETSFVIAADVTNPLLGKSGAVYVYGRQKGAKESDLPILEKNLESFYSVVKKLLKKDFKDLKYAGAAGGLGAGIMAFLGAKEEKGSGIELILKELEFEKRIKGADFIFTGEGKIDEQTSYGKAIWGILKAAKKQNIPVIAIGLYPAASNGVF